MTAGGPSVPIDCRHELPLDQCSYCKPQLYVGPFWDAKFESVCTHPSCHSVIDIGARVRWDSQGTGVMHASHRT